MSAAGPRDTLIVIERRTVAEDDHGGAIETWNAFVSEWAAVRFGTGQERRAAAQEQANQSATFRIPANSKTLSLRTDDRIAGYLGSDWDITGWSLFGRTDIDITATRII